jgi:hypothetical protein
MHGDPVDVFLCPTCGKAVAPDTPGIIRKFEWVDLGERGAGFDTHPAANLVQGRQVFFHPEHFPPPTGVYLDPGRTPTD